MQKLEKEITFYGTDLVIKEKAYLGTELRLPAPQMYMLPIEI
jgi:hypothetical protein